MRRLHTAFLLLLVAAGSHAHPLLALERRVEELRLPNGLSFLFLRRGNAPVFSFATVVHAGAVNEQYGIGGLAHMMEHMAFKGTKTVGTTNYEEEAHALDRLDEAYIALLAEKRKGDRADPEVLSQLEAAFEQAQREADRFVVQNEFAKILEEHGAEDLNAFTGADQTVYLYSLPANKFELWALLESDRMANTVFREFYKENRVVQEERRMTTESVATGRLMDEFLSAAFKEHPYGHGIIGTPSDLQNLTRRDGIRFWETYYVAQNMTVAVVGDFDVREAKEVVAKYFSSLPSGAPPPPVVTVEPPQVAERRVILEDPAQPFVVVGYHAPAESHPDFWVARAVVDILAGGRSSRAYRTLVKEKKMAVQVGGFVGYPGTQYPSLAILYAVASAGTDVYELERALHEVTESMVREPPSPAELEGFKARAKTNFLGQIRSNIGLALALAHAEEFTGGWRSLFTVLDKVNAVTVEDCQRVASGLFRRTNRTVGLIERPSREGGAS